MARKRKPPKYYFEPWVATKSTRHGTEPVVEGLPAEAASALLDAWCRSDRDADWIIWGSKMCDPGLAFGYLTGQPQVTDDRRIIAVRRWLGLPDGSPSHEAVARRIVECVNALTGVGDPGSFVEDVRALLLEQVRGEAADPREDARVISLLARCIPPEEAEEFADACR